MGGTVPVRMLVSVSGPDFNWVPQQVVDMSPEEATKWADGVRGVYDDGPPPADREVERVREQEPERRPADEPQDRGDRPTDTTDAEPAPETTTARRSGRRTTKR